MVSSSDGPDDDWIAIRELPMEEIVRPNDPERFIHVVPDAAGDFAASAMREDSAPNQ